MKNVFLALAFALVLGPVAALADDTNNAPPPAPALTQQQRQALEHTFQTFRTQEEQLHRQIRTEIINSLSPAHRAAIAGIIGQLAISPNPDPATAAKQLDSLLSRSEQQRILDLHTAFRTQSHALHEQMRAQLKSELPAPPAGAGDRHWGGSGQNSHMQPRALDAGTLVLMTLGRPAMVGMGMGMGHHDWMGPGGPPQP